jgi:hypothetical protein
MEIKYSADKRIEKYREGKVVLLIDATERCNDAVIKVIHWWQGL